MTESENENDHFDLDHFDHNLIINATLSPTRPYSLWVLPHADFISQSVAEILPIKGWFFDSADRLSWIWWFFCVYKNTSHLVILPFLKKGKDDISEVCPWKNQENYDFSCFSARLALSLPSVRGEIRTNKKSIRYYFAFSQKRRKLIGNKNATR